MRTLDHVVPPPPPILKQGEEAGPKDQTEEPAQTEGKRATQAQPKDSRSAGMEKGDAVKRGRSAAPSQVESQTGPSAAAGERAKSAAPSEPQLKKEESRSDDKTTSGAASAPARETTRLKSAVEMQKRQMNNAAAESPLQTKARQLATPSAPATAYRMESRGMVSLPPIDSAAIRDSLKLDSLKRAEKTRLDSLKRAKARRPGGL